MAIVGAHLSKDLGYSRENGDENVPRIANVAAMLVAQTASAVVAAISPYRQSRAEARAVAAKRDMRFYEVYVGCPLEVAEGRDPRALYRKARAGEIAHFTGASDPSEEPLEPDLAVDTSAASPEQCAEATLAL